MRIVILIMVLVVGLQLATAQVPVVTNTSSPRNSPPAPDLSKIDIPTIDFCDLVRDPEKFDNQIVRTRALITTGFEQSTLNLPACDSLDTWAEFDRSYDPKAPESKRLYKLLKGGANDYRSAEVMVVGRFTGKKQVFLKTKNKTYYMGYGHLNMFSYLFTVMRVDSATKVPRTKTKH